MFCFAGERQAFLTKALQKTPPKSYVDSVTAFTRWIDGVEQTLRSTSFAVNDLGVMEHQLVLHKVTKCVPRFKKNNFENSSLTIVKFDCGLTDQRRVAQRQVSAVQDLTNEFCDHASNLEYINHAGQDLLKKAPSDDKSHRLRDELQNVNTRWSHLQSTIASRTTRYERTIELIKQHKV